MKQPKVGRILLTLIIALAASLASCVAPPAPKVPVPSSPPEAVRPSHVVERVVQAHNDRRLKAGLSLLTVNSRLEASAIEHARDMAERGKMSHRGSDGSSPFDRMQRQGYRFVAAAENVAYGFDDVESVMSGWMKSPGHRRNILGNFSEIGVGRAISKDGASYWCVTFGTPATR